MSSVAGSSPGATSSRGTRVSQRASRSCTECKRRKIRCDKTVPCSQCLKAKAPERCRVETVELTTKYTKSRQEIEFLHQLQESLSASSLIEAHELITRRLMLLETGQDVNQAARQRLPYHRENMETFQDVLNDQPDDSFNNAMSLMRLGRGYPERNPSSTAVSGYGMGMGGMGMGSESESHDHIHQYLRKVLPEEQLCTKMVTYYLKHLSWHHPVLHHVQFLIEYERFWTLRELPSPQWPAVLLAVLAAAAYNLPARECEGLIDPNALVEKGRDFYQSMMVVLNDTDYMYTHHIHSLQAIIISCMVAHPYGQSVRQMVLISSGLRIAQCLGLAALPAISPHTYPDGTFDSTGRIEEQIQRRIWWQFLVQDYFLVPMAGSYGVSPYHFTTPMPMNCYDEDMVEQHVSVPTINSYCINLSKMALLMPQLVDGLRSPPAKSREAQYRHVQTIDAKMRRLMSDLPPFLRPETPVESNWPVWIEWARSALTISAADKIIMIHRSFLIKSFQDPKTYDFTRRTCVSAALTILNEFHRIKNNDVVRLWIIPTFTVSAAIVIALDIVYRQKNGQSIESKHRELLDETLDSLDDLSVHDENVHKGVLRIRVMMSSQAGSVSPHSWSGERGVPMDVANVMSMMPEEPWAVMANVPAVQQQQPQQQQQHHQMPVQAQGIPGMTQMGMPGMTMLMSPGVPVAGRHGVPHVTQMPMHGMLGVSTVQGVPNVQGLAGMPGVVPGGMMGGVGSSGGGMSGFVKME